MSDRHVGDAGPIIKGHETRDFIHRTFIGWTVQLHGSQREVPASSGLSSPGWLSSQKHVNEWHYMEHHLSSSLLFLAMNHTRSRAIPIFSSSSSQHSSDKNQQPYRRNERSQEHAWRPIAHLRTIQPSGRRNPAQETIGSLDLRGLTIDDCGQPASVISNQEFRVYLEKVPPELLWQRCHLTVSNDSRKSHSHLPRSSSP
jgi:hypothetical protein